MKAIKYLLTGILNNIGFLMEGKVICYVSTQTVCDAAVAKSTVM